MFRTTFLRHTLPLGLLLAAACSGDDDGGDDGVATPTITSTRPVDGATDIAVTTAIEVTFSIAMNEGAGSIVLDPGGPLSGSWSSGGAKITAQPPADLIADTEYTVRLMNFESTASIPAAAESFTFTTAAEPDEEDPVLVSTMPGDDATDIPLNLAAVRFTFSEAMDTNNGTATIDGNATLGAPTWSSGDTVITYVLSGLEASTTYAITVDGFTDVAGNDADVTSLGNDQLDFTTSSGVDTEPPVVTVTVPAEGAADVAAGSTDIVVTFSEAMDDSVGTAILTGAGTATVTPNWSADDTQVTYRVTLAGGVTYRLALNGFTDIAGNALDPTTYLTDGALDFTTMADTGAPGIATTTPAEGTPNVPVGLSQISVTFDEPMTTTASTATFEDTTTQNSVTLTGTWSDETITFDITGLLALGRDYRLSVTGFTDLAGNAVPATALGDGWLDFSTPPDNTAPTVASTTPAEGDNNVVAAVAQIVVQFSEAVDPQTIDAPLSDGTTSVQLTGALSGDGLTATYPVTLTVGASYSFDLSGVTDLAGNALNGLPYLGDGLLDFSLPLPPTGFDCSSPLTIGYATSVAGGRYTFDVQAGTTGGNGSLLCDDSGDGDDIVIEYVKQSDTLANGGELLHVGAASANTVGFNLEVLSGACAVGASSTQHHCYWNNTDIESFLDVPAGTYWIWVSRNTSGSFQGGSVYVEEVPATAAEGEGCWLPWTTASAIYTAPVNATDPHVWEIPSTAVNSFDMDVTWGGTGSISCDDHPTYGDIHGFDTVVEYPRTSTNAIVTIDVAAGTGSNDTINVEVLDRCNSRDPQRVSLGCNADVTTSQLVVGPGAGPIYIWMSTEATGDDWPGATVEVREILPALGESCATAHPVGAGTTTLNPTSTARLGGPACLTTGGSLEWYRYTVANGRVQINANAGTELGVIDANDSSELGCSASPASLGVGRTAPVGTELCIAVPVGASTSLTIVDTPDVYTGVGTSVTEVPVTPFSTSWNTDYWMAASPSWVYFGRSGGDVQRFPNPTTTATMAVEVFSGSLNVGYGAVALFDEQLFSLDNTTSSSNNRLFRLWDGQSSFIAEAWDLTPSYPTQDARALTFDGTNLIYATHATNSVDVLSVPVAAAQSPTQLGTNNVIDNIYGIAADATYLYFTGISVADNVDGVYRLLRSELGNPSATPELMLAIDVGSSANPIYLDDPTAPQYLYVRQGNPADIHVIELPQSSAPIYRGVLSDLGVSADYAWTYDAASNSIYLFETETVSGGRIVRVF
ncbi:MAG: Ig-like domain-containing protein [Deltaproteobacteria bacterium]